jgi:hypothetical protein
VSRAALVAAGCAALALVTAAGIASNRRQRELETSPLPSVENGGPRGLAAARAWLAATGRPHRVLAREEDRPAPGEVLLLVAPPATLGAPEADALISHAEAGGRVVWAMGGGPQPDLERRLGVVRTRAPSDLEVHLVTSLVPHPLFDRIALQTGGAALRATGAEALPVAGEEELAAAASIGLGRGEAIVLAGPEPLENYRLGEGANLSLLSRIAASGPIAFDERHLVRAGRSGAGARLPWLVGAQLLLVAAALLVAVGRRLGTVRVVAGEGKARSARDYVASLGALYRRAGDAEELRASTWRSLRRAVERLAGVPAAAPDAEVARRLAARSPAAAGAFARALAARGAPPGEAGLVALLRAAAEVEAALRRTTPDASRAAR